MSCFALWLLVCFCVVCVCVRARFGLQGLYLQQMRRVDLLRATQSAESLGASFVSMASAYSAAATSLLHSRGEDCFQARFSNNVVTVAVLPRPAAGTEGANVFKSSAFPVDKDDEDEDMK